MLYCSLLHNILRKGGYFETAFVWNVRTNANIHLSEAALKQSPLTRANFHFGKTGLRTFGLSSYNRPLQLTPKGTVQGTVATISELLTEVPEQLRELLRHGLLQQSLNKPADLLTKPVIVGVDSYELARVCDGLAHFQGMGPMFRKNYSEGKSPFYCSQSMPVVLSLLGPFFSMATDRAKPTDGLVARDEEARAPGCLG